MLFVLLALAAALGFASSALANNTFPGTVITGSSGSFTGTTVGSNGQAGEPAPPAGGTINSMWYSWTAPASGVFTFGTCNTTAASTTNYDSSIAAYTGAAVNALTSIGGVDDVTGCASTAGANLGSVVAFTATSGTTYRLQIDGYQANTGAFQLNYGLVGFVFATTDGSATEGGDTGAFTVRLTSVPTANVTVTIGASAQCTFASNTLTFTLANWNVPQTVTATATDDAIVEGVHSCTPATITAAGGNFNTATGTPPVITVNDNDSATVTIANTSDGAEPATNGLMTVTQTAVSATNTVIAYSVGGTATAGSDYTALSGTVTILAGATTATIPIPVLDDAIVEPNETVIVTLTSISSGLPTLGATLVATNTITSNDAATVALANTTDAAEPATNGVMTVTQTAVSATNTVIAYSIGGTATPGTDYTALSGTVTVLAGATTATIPVPILDDVVVEGSETVIVTLTSVSSGLATLGAPLAATNTIADNDAATVSIANTVNASEPATNGTMTVTQTAVSSQNTVIAYTVTGTATSGTDYTALSGTVTVLAGATTAAINISVIDDLIIDPSETVIVTLTSVSSGLATLGAPLVATSTIADNDVASFSIANAVNTPNISAPATLTYTITISNTGNVPLTGLSITDALLQGGSPRTLTTGPGYASGDTDLNGQIDATETWIYAATYAVTQSNIDNGTAFSNTATFDTAETTAQTSNAATTTITVSPQLAIDKTADTPGPLSAGQVINYSYLVTNTGNVTISGVNVNETAFNGNGTPVPAPTPTGPTTLSPGQTVTFVASYTVTQDDIDLLQ